MTRIILASQSSGRKQLLDWVQLPYESLPADIDETELPGEFPRDYVQRLAQAKAKTIFNQLNNSGIVIGADTTVYHQNQIIGKPTDLDDARNILRSFRNDSHTVYTGLSVISTHGEYSTVDESTVTFRNFSEADLEVYLQHEDPLSKAGGYTILRHGKLLTEKIEGSFSGVIGLPIKALVQYLNKIEVTVSSEGIKNLRFQVGRFD